MVGTTFGHCGAFKVFFKAKGSGFGKAKNENDFIVDKTEQQIENEKMDAHLAAGYVLGVCPEGKMNKTPATIAPMSSERGRSRGSAARSSAGRLIPRLTRSSATLSGELITNEKSGYSQSRLEKQLMVRALDVKRVVLPKQPHVPVPIMRFLP